jgi:hypothetical protein
MNAQKIAYLHVDGLAHALAKDPYGIPEHFIHGRVEAGDLAVIKAGAPPEGIDTCAPADLIGVGVTDAGDKALVGEDALDLAVVAAQSLAKEVKGQVWICSIWPQLAKSRDLV